MPLDTARASFGSPGALPPIGSLGAIPPCPGRRSPRRRAVCGGAMSSGLSVGTADIVGRPYCPHRNRPKQSMELQTVVSVDADFGMGSRVIPMLSEIPIPMGTTHWGQFSLLTERGKTSICPQHFLWFSPSRGSSKNPWNTGFRRGSRLVPRMVTRLLDLVRTKARSYPHFPNPYCY